MSLIYKSLQRLEEQERSFGSNPRPQPEAAGGHERGRFKTLLLVVGAGLLVLLAGIWLSAALLSQQGKGKAVTAAQVSRGSPETSSRSAPSEAGEAHVPSQAAGSAESVRTGANALDAGSRPGSPATLSQGGGQAFSRAQHLQLSQGAVSEPLRRKSQLIRSGLRREGRRIRLFLEFTSRPEYRLSRGDDPERLILAFERTELAPEALVGLLEARNGEDVSISPAGQQLEIRLSRLDTCRDAVLPAGSDYGPRLVLDCRRKPAQAQAERDSGKAQPARSTGSLAASKEPSKEGSRKPSEGSADGGGQADRLKAGATDTGNHPSDGAGDTAIAAGRTPAARQDTHGSRPDLETSISGPKSPRELLRAAEKASQRGQWPEAEELLRQALSKEPSYVPARRSLASIFIRSERRDRAERLLRKGLQMSPDALPLRTLLGGLLIEKKAWGRALEVLTGGEQPAVSEQPEHFARIAWIYRQTGRYTEAATLYARLTQADPEAGTWWLGLGLSLEGQGNAEAAGRAYRAALDCPDLGTSLRRFVQQRLKGLGT